MATHIARRLSNSRGQPGKDGADDRHIGPRYPIGVELDEKGIMKYPYGQNYFLRLFEDGWERRE